MFTTAFGADTDATRVKLSFSIDRIAVISGIVKLS